MIHVYYWTPLPSLVPCECPLVAKAEVYTSNCNTDPAGEGHDTVTCAWVTLDLGSTVWYSEDVVSATTVSFDHSKCVGAL